MPTMNLSNATKLSPERAYPVTAKSVRIRIAKIVPADLAVLLYAPAAALDPVRFDGPEATVDIKVRGHDLFVQPVLGNTSCEITYLGYVDDRSHAAEDLAAGLAS